MNIIDFILSTTQKYMMSLSMMFKTFVWVLGDVPLLKIDTGDALRVIEMDTIGFSCMKHDLLVRPGSSMINVKLYYPDLNFEFKITSPFNLTVLDFVLSVNAESGKYLDVMKDEILVEDVYLKDDTIVITTYDKIEF